MTVTSAPMATASLTPMCPSPPRPTTATLLPGPTPQRRRGEYVVMPAQSRGAATSRSIPSGIGQTKRWEVTIDRVEAAKYGIGVRELAPYVQLVTSGVKLGSYRPDDATDELDIRVRLPREERTFDALDSLRVVTPQGQVPVSNFIERKAVPQVVNITRLNGVYSMGVAANLLPDVPADQKIAQLQAWQAEQEWPQSVEIVADDGPPGRYQHLGPVLHQHAAVHGDESLRPIRALEGDQPGDEGCYEIHVARQDGERTMRTVRRDLRHGFVDQDAGREHDAEYQRGHASFSSEIAPIM